MHDPDELISRYLDALNAGTAPSPIEFAVQLAATPRMQRGVGKVLHMLAALRYTPEAEGREWVWQQLAARLQQEQTTATRARPARWQAPATQQVDSWIAPDYTLDPPAFEEHDDLLETPAAGEVEAAPTLDESEPDESALKEVAAEIVPDEELEKVFEHTFQAADVGDVAADTVRMYLREIGATPLLNAAAETELAIRMEKGRDADAKLAVLGIPSSVPNWATSASTVYLAAQQRDDAANAENNPIPLLADIEQLLIEREQGNAAKQRLVQANLRLVVSITRRYLGRGLSLPDLIQEGNLGLMRAADKFDFRRGFKFSTYATWWIRQAITRAISDQGRTIRLPVHVSEMVARLRRATHQLQQDLRREPTEDELAKELHTTPSKVRRIMELARQPVSLEAPLDASEDSFLGDFIEDANAPTPLEEAQRQLLREEVQQLLAKLSERERRIVELRFGLDDGKQHTLEEVAQQFGITRERIRQIETKILRKLRHQRFGGSTLQSYLDDD